MILPSWMRFIKGVVDSEDIPLNLSRELLQNTTLIAKIRETLTDRLIKFLNDRARIEPEEYLQFYNEYKVFIAEGIATEEAAHRRDEMAKLLRYESSNLPAGQMTSLSTYLENMKENQRYIFFLPANNRAQAENSPYLEAIKNKGYEVLFMYDPFDEGTCSCYWKMPFGNISSNSQASVSKWHLTLYKHEKSCYGENDEIQR